MKQVTMEAGSHLSFHSRPARIVISEKTPRNDSGSCRYMAGVESKRHRWTAAADALVRYWSRTGEYFRETGNRQRIQGRTGFEGIGHIGFQDRGTPCGDSERGLAYTSASSNRSAAARPSASKRAL